MLYLGIDPGRSGGAALIGCKDGDCVLCSMPETERDVFNVLRRFNEQNVPQIFAVIEWIHPAIQGIGKSAMSKLYGNYMALRMALTAVGVPFEIVQARKWQQALGIAPRKRTETRSRWKNRLKAKAQQLFPHAPITLATCDALLIAEYARRAREGLLAGGDSHARVCHRRPSSDRSERRRL